MKKYIIFLVLILILPLNVKAFEKATDTTHESYLMPYYTNIFNDYNSQRYIQALSIINNSPKYSNSAKTYKYDYIVVKKQDKYTTIIRVQSNQEYLNLDYSKSSNNYSFSINQRDTSVPSTAIYLDVMQLNSGTTDTTFRGSSTNGYILFTHYNGYSTSGWNGSILINQSDILYSTIDIKLEGNNIYNGNLLRKIVTYGTPYNYTDYSALDSTGRQEYYKNMTFQNYAKSTTTLLKSGDTFYSHDLEGTKYSFSSETYKNVTITIPNNMAIAEGTFDLQFKTDNSKVYSPAIYGLYNGKYELITYLDYNYDKFFPTTDIYTFSKSNIYLNGEIFFEFIKNYEGFQIRYELEKTSSQNATFIYNGDFNISIDYDNSNFEYIIPGQDDKPSFTDNGKWFERTEEYFKSLGDMELLEKLNPIYWLKGLGMILVDLLVPTKEDNSFQQVYDTIYEKFPIIKDLKSIIEQVFDESLINTPNQAPKITINLAPLGIGLGTYTLIDFAMFDDFISYIRIFIVSFMLLELVFWYYRKIGSVI